MDDEPPRPEWLTREFFARLADLERVAPAGDEERERLWLSVLRIAGVCEELSE